MEWQLPIQKLEVGNIYIASPWLRESRNDSKYKPISSLSYIGTQFRMPSLSVLFPPLPVIEYVPFSGKLVIDISETSLACIKLTAFQETILQSIRCHQSAWFGSSYSIEEIRSKYIPIYKDNRLILHCHMNGPPVYANNEWSSEPIDTHLKPGVRVRVAVKMYGISYLYNQTPINLLAEVPEEEGQEQKQQQQQLPTWSGKSRIQHKVMGILVQK